MGLDMYLYKKTYVKNWSHEKPEDQFVVTLTRGGKPYKPIRSNRITNITEELAYWRKFNALHNWFVENCADGVDDQNVIHVYGEQLNELHGTLLKTQEILNNSKLIKKTVIDYQNVDIEYEVYDCEEEIMELFPPTPGFFSGDVEIDKYYKENVDDTIEVLDEILDEDPELTESYNYQASW